MPPTSPWCEKKVSYDSLVCGGGGNILILFESVSLVCEDTLAVSTPQLFVGTLHSCVNSKLVHEITALVCDNTWLVCENASFVCENTWLVYENASFVCENTWLVYENASFVCENTWLVYENASFVCENTWLGSENASLVCENTSFARENTSPVCEKSVVKIDSTKHRRFSPCSPVSSDKSYWTVERWLLLESIPLGKTDAVEITLFFSK